MTISRKRALRLSILSAVIVLLVLCVGLHSQGVLRLPERSNFTSARLVYCHSYSVLADESAIKKHYTAAYMDGYCVLLSTKNDLHIIVPLLESAGNSTGLDQLLNFELSSLKLLQADVPFREVSKSEARAVISHDMHVEYTSVAERYRFSIEKKGSEYYVGVDIRADLDDNALLDFRRPTYLPLEFAAGSK